MEFAGLGNLTGLKTLISVNNYHLINLFCSRHSVVNLLDLSQASNIIYHVNIIVRLGNKVDISRAPTGCIGSPLQHENVQFPLVIMDRPPLLHFS